MSRTHARSRRGFTLTETLVTLLIVSLLSMAIAVGIGAAARVYKESVAMSESQLLASTLSKAMMDELRYARELPDTAADNPAFDSSTFGSGVQFSTDAATGQLKLGSYYLVSSGAYSTNTDQHKRAEAQVQWTGSQFQVTLTIFLGETRVLNTVEFTVTPLNPPKPSETTS